jgi:hypothetical protein
MNNRIKEIAKFNERVYNFFETGPVQRAAIEEFAELIILDCVKNAVEEIQYECGWKAADIIAERLKENYGINT